MIVTAIRFRRRAYMVSIKQLSFAGLWFKRCNKLPWRRRELGFGKSLLLLHKEEREATMYGVLYIMFPALRGRRYGAVTVKLLVNILKIEV